MSILHQVPSNAKINRELKKIVFGKVLRCPHCGSRQIKKYEKRYHCKRCRKFFSLISCTWLKGMKLPLQTFWLLLWSWVNKVPIDQAQKVSGVSEPTVRKWYEKFRNHLPQEKLDSLRLEGIVQIDEAYRGPKGNKYAIIGAKQAKQAKGKPRKIVCQVLPKKSVDRRDTVSFLSQHVVPNSDLHSDGAAIYKGIANWWQVNHTYEIHSKWEFALTSEIEGLWGTMFTFIRRMYHHVNKDKIGSVVQEFTARFCFPEWFECPENYLNIALQPLSFPTKRKVQNMKEIYYDFLSLNMPILPLNLAQKSRASVSSC